MMVAPYNKNVFHSTIDYKTLIQLQANCMHYQTENIFNQVSKPNIGKHAVKVKTNNPKVSRRDRNYGGRNYD